MTTLTNSESNVLNYTIELLETILSQFNSSNMYYTSGENDMFVKIGSNKLLLLDYTYHINSTMFQII